MRKPKLTPVISITSAKRKGVPNGMNRGTRLSGCVLVIRPQQPDQYRIAPNGPDAA